MSLILYIAIMAGVTYLIRVVPFTVSGKKSRTIFCKASSITFPYAVLSAMTIPAIFYSTGNVITAAVGTVVAVLLAYWNLPLIVVALAASAAALVTGFFCMIQVPHMQKVICMWGLAVCSHKSIFKMNW